MPLPLPERVEAELREREKQRILKELDRWREVTLSRPRLIELFWEGDVLCWAEELIKGAPLSSIDEPLPLVDGLSLIEEVLFTLDDHQSYTDFMTGEPLLHLNLHPSSILRAEEGQLFLMDPLCPTWIQLKAQHTKQRLEGLDGAHAPELTRGRSEASSDLYALGMSTLSAMSGMSLKKIDQRLNAERLFTQDLTLAPSVRRFFERLVHFRASERFSTPSEALSALRSLPRELYEPLGALLHQAAHPPSLPESPQPLVTERAASVRVSDDLSDALGDFELSESEESAEPQLNRARAGSEAEVNIFDAEQVASGEDRVSRERLLIDYEEEHDDAHASGISFAFYTRAHEPRLPPQRRGRRASEGVRDGVTEVEVVEEERSYALWWTLALLTLALAWFATQRGATKQELTRALSSELTPREQGRRTSEGALSEGLSTNAHAPRAQGVKAQASQQLTETQTARRARLPVWVRFEEGAVWVGALEGEGYADEHPRRRVKVEPFELSKTEVTVSQYARCVDGGACDVERVKTPDWGDPLQCNWDHPDRLDHPMNCVSWRQALDYARWVGGRLPSEAEWSFAAQGGREAPQEGLRYPWGQKSRGCGYAVLHHRTRGDGCGEGGSASVCSALKGNSPQGLCDLAGNVWEWMTDEYHPSYQDAPVDGSAWALFPLDRWSQVERALRGAAFDERDLPRVARRNHYGGGAHLATVGFRVARDVARPPRPELTEPLVPATPDSAPDGTPNKTPDAGTGELKEERSGERRLEPLTD